VPFYDQTSRNGGFFFVCGFGIRLIFSIFVSINYYFWRIRFSK